MPLWRYAPQPSLALAALLFALLAVLATLQYRWIGEVTEAERERMRSALESAATRLADDFDREITRTFLAFRLDPETPRGELGGVLARRLDDWSARAPDPRLVKDVFVVARGEEGGLGLARLDREQARLEREAWPPELLGLRDRLEAAPGRRPVRPWRAAHPPGAIVSELPALIVPLERPREGPGPPYERRARPLPEGAVVVVLDADSIRDVLLPELKESHFAGLEDYDLAVVRRDDPREVVYRSSPAAKASPEAPDLTVGLLSLRPFEELRRERIGPRPRFGARAGGRRLPGPRELAERGEWRLLVTHKGGSLAVAVSRARRRNLAVGLGVLLLLGGSTALTLASARRAQTLARQQMAFVTGVSHEMRTPLAAVRSAGQNLADGVVADPVQVKRYGAMIEREGRRLSAMVEEALELAGSEGRVYRLEEVEPSRVVDAALEECRFALEEKGIRVAREVPADLPRVRADAAALRTALRNLLDNAIKYGRSPMAVRAGATPGPGGGEVRLAVADSGPGIPGADAARIFEPFYRGRQQGARVPGSGLGLAVVRQIAEAHGGRVSLETGKGGSVFTLHLPALAAGAPVAGGGA